MDKIEEIWRDIKGFEGLYQISNLGRVKSLQRIIIRGNGSPITINERIRKSKVQDVGYLKISLCKDGVHSSHRIHRLIAEAFIENPFKKRTINHKDGNKLNNSIDNLEWATHSENITHAYNNNLRESILTDGQIKAIRSTANNAYHFGRNAFALKYGVSVDVITRVVKRLGRYK